MKQCVYSLSLLPAAQELTGYLRDKVYGVVRQIPQGKVTTYGALPTAQPYRDPSSKP